MYYRSDAFGTAARGNVFVGFYKNGLVRIVLSEDGKKEVSQETFDADLTDVSPALDIKDFPGGAICGVSYKPGSEFSC